MAAQQRGATVLGAESREKRHSHLNPTGEEEDTGNSRKLGIMGRKVTCDGSSLGTADMKGGGAVM